MGMAAGMQLQGSRSGVAQRCAGVCRTAQLHAHPSVSVAVCVHACAAFTPTCMPACVPACLMLVLPAWPQLSGDSQLVKQYQDASRNVVQALSTK